MITLTQFGVVNTTNSVGVSLVFILLFVLSALSLIYVKLKISEDRKHVRINSTVFTLKSRSMFIGGVVDLFIYRFSWGLYYFYSYLNCG